MEPEASTKAITSISTEKGTSFAREIRAASRFFSRDTGSGPLATATVPSFFLPKPNTIVSSFSSVYLCFNLLCMFSAFCAASLLSYCDERILQEPLLQVQNQVAGSVPIVGSTG